MHDAWQTHRNLFELRVGRGCQKWTQGLSDKWGGRSNQLISGVAARGQELATLLRQEWIRINHATCPIFPGLTKIIL
jgi:hypothetical protein